MHMSNLIRKIIRSTPKHRQLPYYFFFALFLVYSGAGAQHPAGKLALHGLHKPVEVIRDSFGINHIYAQDQHDLFFTGWPRDPGIPEFRAA